MIDLPPLAAIPVCLPTTDNIPFSSEDEIPTIIQKKKGRKKGCNIDLLSLNPGGIGGRLELTRR